MSQNELFPRIVKIQIIVGIFAFAVTVLAATQLPGMIRTQQKLTTETKKLETTISTQKEDIQAQDDEIEKQERLLKEQQDRIEQQREEVNTLANRVEKLRVEDQRLTQNNLIKKPVETVVTPRASVEPLQHNEIANNPSYYKHYKMWLEVPEDRQSEIAKVTYFMDHSSFPSPLYIGDRDDDYSMGYDGYGALGEVEITLILKDGSSRKVHFNQHAATYRQN